MSWALRQDEHEVYLGIKDVWKEKIPEAYERSLLKEIKYEVLNLIHKSKKDIIGHINNQCLSLSNMEKKEKLKDMEFPWNPEEDIAVCFTKLHKEQDWLNKSGINWDDSQKVTQSVDKMYSS